MNQVYLNIKYVATIIKDAYLMHTKAINRTWKNDPIFTPSVQSPGHKNFSVHLGRYVANTKS